VVTPCGGRRATGKMLLSAMDASTADFVHNSRYDEKFNSALDQLSCAICMEILNRPSCLRCGHFFCSDCLTRALLKCPRCPLCRFSVSPDEERPVLVQLASYIERVLPGTGRCDRGLRQDRVSSVKASFYDRAKPQMPAAVVAARAYRSRIGLSYPFVSGVPAICRVYTQVGMSRRLCQTGRSSCFRSFFSALAFQLSSTMVSSASSVFGRFSHIRILQWWLLRWFLRHWS